MFGYVKICILIKKITSTFSIQNIRKTCKIISTINLLSIKYVISSKKGHVFRFNIPNKTKESV